MATDATLQTISVSRREDSSTAWFWWKETRQLAPLIALLIIVAMLILLLNAVVGVVNGNAFGFRVPYEITMLVFPGLFATGAGPLLVGQERSQRTLDWLALLPISAKRLATTKLCVAIVGLVIMWVFSLLVVAAFGLSDGTASRWIVGDQTGYSDNPLSYPVWISHSLFILLSGFFVAWRIQNQFYSLIVLIPLAFSPLIATSIVSEFVAHPMMSGDLDWINFAFTLVGIVVITPLTYRAAMRTLGPDAAPTIRPLVDVSVHSPARETNDSIAPRFGTHTAPVIWQSIHSAKGTLAILIGMLVLSFIATLLMCNFDNPRGMMRFLPLLLLSAPFAVCWLGVGVFKHDGASERVRFLADRGVSHRKTYFALHAVPVAILCTAMLVYAIWNLTISHHKTDSGFAAALPSLVTILLFVVLIYGVSQWVSQFVRTLILSVILAPILSVVVASWLSFAYGALELPTYGLVLCAIAPFLATYLTMRRYMDSTDRPATFIVGGIVIAIITLVPIGFAAAHVYSIPAIDSKIRAELLSEQAPLGDGTSWISLSIGAFNLSEPPGLFDRKEAMLRQLEERVEQGALDPRQVVAPLVSAESSINRVAVKLNQWEYQRWFSEMTYVRIVWRQDQTDTAWTKLAAWIDASAILLPALRHSTVITDQEFADRLEVLLLDTLEKDVPIDRRDEMAVHNAINAIGNPASRAAARRRAVLVTWRQHFQDSKGRYMHHYLDALNFQPQGLLPWVEPRLYDSLTLAMLEGIKAAEGHSDDLSWRLEMHAIHQPHGVFATSRYGNAMRSRPAMQTMTYAINGYGQLWGRDWEYVDPSTTIEQQGFDR